MPQPKTAARLYLIELREKIRKLAERYDELPAWKKGVLEYQMGAKNDKPRLPIEQKR